MYLDFLWILFNCECQETKVKFGLVYLFNGIPTPYGLFSAEIWFIGKKFDYNRGEKESGRVEEEGERKEERRKKCLLWIVSFLKRHINFSWAI